VIFDVLDVDIKDGRPGCESIARLRIAGHLLGAWGSAITPTGGRHLLYMPSSEGAHVDRASGLDFRGVGSYVAAAPSRTDAGTYQWEFCGPGARGRPFNWSAAMEHFHGPKPRPEHRTEPSGDIGGLVGFLGHAKPGERLLNEYQKFLTAPVVGSPSSVVITNHDVISNMNRVTPDL
jgi:hypothetical protein